MSILENRIPDPARSRYVLDEFSSRLVEGAKTVITEISMQPDIDAMLLAMEEYFDWFWDYYGWIVGQQYLMRIIQDTTEKFSLKFWKVPVSLLRIRCKPWAVPLLPCLRQSIPVRFASG